jgi:hypothetical protein
VKTTPLPVPAPPAIVGHDNSGAHEYALVAVGVQGQRSAASRIAKSGGLARLQWDSVPGADSYIVLRDGKEIPGLLRIEGSQKNWTDKGKP